MQAEIEAALRLTETPQHCDGRAEGVSAWSVQQHLEHLLLTDTAIADGLARGLVQGLAAEPAAVEGASPNRWGYVILWSGRIPRGRGRAPDFVVPHEMPLDEVRAGLEAIRSRFDAFGGQLGELRRLQATIAHPVLGEFTAAQWLRFGHIHHLHHNRIIGDIQRASS